MDFSQPPWSDATAFIRNEGLHIAVIAIVAFGVYVVARALLHGLFTADLRHRLLSFARAHRAFPSVDAFS